MTVEEVVGRVVSQNLGEGRYADITDFHPNRKDDYVSVICVWLGKIWELIDHKIVVTPRAEFILWNDKKVPQRCDCDLHGFVKADRTIDWGQMQTMNLMR